MPQATTRNASPAPVLGAPRVTAEQLAAAQRAQAWWARRVPLARPESNDSLEHDAIAVPAQNQAGDERMHS